MKLSLVAVFIACLSLCLSAPAFCSENDVLVKAEKYRMFSYRAQSLKKTMAENLVRIAPSLDYNKQQYDLALKSLAYFKDDIVRILCEELGRGKSLEFNRFCAYLANIQEEDTAKGAFSDPVKILKEKIQNMIFNNPDNSSFFREKLDLLMKSLIPAMSESSEKRTSRVPIYISFHWHMHQPIYWPGEDVLTTDGRNVYSYSVLGIFFDRSGPYTSWPFDAIQAGADAKLPHFGAQVSFSGSLIENLNRIESAGKGFSGWAQWYKKARALRTESGNPRLDLVAFGYHHPLMGLIGYDNIREQIRRHRELVQKVFGEDVSYSKGIFPPENAFGEWMIPALVDEGLDWVFVDNIHFNRAVKNYPWVKGENLYPPNPADQVNPPVKQWIQLNGLWAPSKVSSWGYRPHFVEYRDRDTGKVSITKDGKKARMIAVPTARYMGNEDGRGGFGALNYEHVMSQLEEYNDDPAHPILIVLHHDGDNYGGGSSGYYHGNFYRFVEWANANRDRFVPTTVEDYLKLFPPDPKDVIHVESGSWAGADNGDPEFKKWNGDPDPSNGYSPDRNSWGTMVAGRNFVNTARQLEPSGELAEKAWDALLVAETSCYEYWDGTEMWDSHPTRGVNAAIELARKVIKKDFEDKTPPSIYLPQREPYNPGGYEWGPEPETSSVEFWTYAFDVSGLNNVTLNYRERSAEGIWKKIEMTGKGVPSQTNPRPIEKAREYTAVLKGLDNVTLDYYVSSSDTRGNQSETPVLSVYIGKQTAQVEKMWTPEEPSSRDLITIYSANPGYLHWGVNSWQLPPKVYWPEGSVKWKDGKAVESKLTGPDEQGRYSVKIGPFENSGEGIQIDSVDFVFHNLDDSWSKDKKIPVKND